MVEFWHWPDYEGIEIIRDVSSGGTICAITGQRLQPGNVTAITQRLELAASGIDALQQALTPLLQTQPDPYQQSHSCTVLPPGRHRPAASTVA